MLDTKSDMPTQLADLVASRLCHDLVNPLGAIGNGVELLEMTGKADGPEMELIRDAVRAAEARIRLFRLAFGGASIDQTISAREAREAVLGYFHQSRIAAEWLIEGERPRAEVKLGALLVLCVETTLPMGGDLLVSLGSENDWTIRAQGPRLKANDPIWEMLRADSLPSQLNLRPADAQFPIALHTAASLGKSIFFRFSETELTVSAR